MASTRLHRSEVRAQLDKLRRAHDLTVTIKAIEERLGYPLVEANMDELRGIIAALHAVVSVRHPAAAVSD